MATPLFLQLLVALAYLVTYIARVVSVISQAPYFYTSLILTIFSNPNMLYKLKVSIILKILMLPFMFLCCIIRAVISIMWYIGTFVIVWRMFSPESYFITKFFQLLFYIVLFYSLWVYGNWKLREWNIGRRNRYLFDSALETIFDIGKYFEHLIVLIACNGTVLAFLVSMIINPIRSIIFVWAHKNIQFNQAGDVQRFGADIWKNLWKSILDIFCIPFVILIFISIFHINRYVKNENKTHALVISCGIWGTFEMISFLFASVFVLVTLYRIPSFFQDFFFGDEKMSRVVREEYAGVVLCFDVVFRIILDLLMCVSYVFILLSVFRYQQIRQLMSERKEKKDAKEIPFYTKRKYILLLGVLSIRDIVVHVVIGIPTLLSIVRTRALIRGWKRASYNNKYRVVLWCFMKFILDIPAGLSVVILYVTVYRFPNFVNYTKTTKRGYQKVAFREVLELLIDIPFIAMSPLSLWRVPVLIYKIRDKQMNSKKRRKESMKQIYEMLVDILFAITFFLAGISVYHVSTLFYSWNHKIANSYRKAVLFYFYKDIVQSIPRCVATWVVMLTFWRVLVVIKHIKLRRNEPVIVKKIIWIHFGALFFDIICVICSVVLTITVILFRQLVSIWKNNKFYVCDSECKFWNTVDLQVKIILLTRNLSQGTMKKIILLLFSVIPCSTYWKATGIWQLINSDTRSVWMKILILSYLNFMTVLEPIVCIMFVVLLPFGWRRKGVILFITTNNSQGDDGRIKLVTLVHLKILVEFSLFVVVDGICCCTMILILVVHIYRVKNLWNYFFPPLSTEENEDDDDDEEESESSSSDDEEENVEVRESFKKLLFYEFGQFILDYPVLIISFVCSLITLFRIPRWFNIVYLKSHDDQERRKRLHMMIASTIVDFFTLIFSIFVIVFLWRIPFLIYDIFAIGKSYRKAVYDQFRELVVDLRSLLQLLVIVYLLHDIDVMLIKIVRITIYYLACFYRWLVKTIKKIFSKKKEAKEIDVGNGRIFAYELFFEIFSYLPPEDLVCSARGTCKYWNELSQKDYIWRQIHYKHTGTSGIYQQAFKNAFGEELSEQYVKTKRKQWEEKDRRKKPPAYYTFGYRYNIEKEFIFCLKWILLSFLMFQSKIIGIVVSPIAVLNAFCGRIMNLFAWFFVKTSPLRKHENRYERQTLDYVERRNNRYGINMYGNEVRFGNWSIFAPMTIVIFCWFVLNSSWLVLSLGLVLPIMLITTLFRPILRYRRHGMMSNIGYFLLQPFIIIFYLNYISPILLEFGSERYSIRALLLKMIAENTSLVGFRLDLSFISPYLLLIPKLFYPYYWILKGQVFCVEFVYNFIIWRLFEDTWISMLVFPILWGLYFESFRRFYHQIIIRPWFPNFQNFQGVEVFIVFYVGILEFPVSICRELGCLGDIFVSVPIMVWIFWPVGLMWISWKIFLVPVIVFCCYQIFLANDIVRRNWR